MRTCVVCSEATTDPYYIQMNPLCFHCWKDGLYVPKGEFLNSIVSLLLFIPMMVILWIDYRLHLQKKARHK